MGHAGAIVMGTYGSAESKITMFSKANIPVAKKPVELPILLAGKMEKKLIIRSKFEVKSVCQSQILKKNR